MCLPTQLLPEIRHGYLKDGHPEDAQAPDVWPGAPRPPGHRFALAPRRMRKRAPRPQEQSEAYAGAAAASEGIDQACVEAPASASPACHAYHICDTHIGDSRVLEYKDRAEPSM